MNHSFSIFKIVILIITISISLNTGFGQYKDILIENRDTTINPAVDFFKYANGGWLKRNPVPPSEPRWGIANLVKDETFDRMKKLSEEAAADNSTPKGSNSQLIGDFYFAAMDTVTIEKQGIEKLNPELEQINSMGDKMSLIQAIVHMQKIGCNPLFGIGVYQDSKKSDEYALYLWQGGLGLPDRDYYTNTDQRTKKIREEYVNHLTKMFELLGDDKATAEKNSSVVMKIETDLANSSRKLDELDDPYANYNKMDLNELQKLNPSMNWKETLKLFNVKKVDSIIVGQPEFYKEVENALITVSIDEWKAYLRWNLINTFAAYLSKPFEEQNFYFYNGVLSGVREMRPRWKRVLNVEESYLGEALGQLFVEKYYSPATKKRYEDLANKVIAAYRIRIENLDWMGGDTKQDALKKLDAVRKKVGYPDKWKDYSAMNVSRNSYAENIIDGNLWYFDYYFKRLGNPVDREEWYMTPQTYSAYYSSSNNEIVLPAAVFFIPNFPDSLADDALIYGYAGASTIGHEITHGFDDEGRKYDGAGNLKSWWSKADEEKFLERSQKYVDQYNNYIVLDSMHVNGKSTLGENIADLGGIVIALDAFKMTEQYKKGEIISGLTPLQRYFLGYALGWLSHQRDESLAHQIMTDVHSPAFLRVIGPMSNIPEFYEAFNVKEGDPMWRQDSVRVRIW